MTSEAAHSILRYVEVRDEGHVQGHVMCKVMWDGQSPGNWAGENAILCRSASASSFLLSLGFTGVGRAAIESTNISNSSIRNESNSNRIGFLTICNRSNRITCYLYEFE